MAGPANDDAARASGRCLQMLRALRSRIDAADKARKKLHTVGDLEGLNDLHHWLKAAKEDLDMGMQS
jgi:hypothetical protein